MQGGIGLSGYSLCQHSWQMWHCFFASQIAPPDLFSPQTAHNTSFPLNELNVPVVVPKSFEVLVVRPGKLPRWGDHVHLLDTKEGIISLLDVNCTVVAAFLDPLGDLTDESVANYIWLEHHKCALEVSLKTYVSSSQFT